MESELKPDEIGRYQVIEKKEQGIYNDNIRRLKTTENPPYAPVVYTHKYYLLDTRTGEITEIDFSKTK